MGPVRQAGRRRQGGGRHEARRADAGAVLQVGPGGRAAEPAQAAFETACRSLAARRQTRAELARKLARKGFADDVVRAALDRVARLGFLDDTGLAADHARTMADGRLYGRRRIAQALAARGLSREAIASALDAAAPADPGTEVARARRALAQARRVPAPGDRDARCRAAQYLARRGFDWDTVEAALGAPLDTEGDA